MTPSNKFLSEIVTYTKYAKVLKVLNRKESFEETINRNMGMNLEKFPKLSKDIMKAYELVHDGKIMPSMRGLQFGGDLITKNNIRLYNCSAEPIDDPKCFGELMFLLLSGTGVGYSVQKCHIKNLPIIKLPKQEGTFVIQDSIYGWAQAIDVLVEAYFYNRVRPIFDFNNVSAKGTILSNGSKAPGPAQLKTSLELIEKIFKSAIGRQLFSFEINDILCIEADCVVSGGIRRSSSLCLFDADDKDMLRSKSGKWWTKFPWRARANISANLIRYEIGKEQFDYIFNICKESKSGEPAIVWSNGRDSLFNPCVTKDTIIHTNKGPKLVRDLINKPFKAVVNNKEYTSLGFFKTGIKPIFELKTKEGFSLKCTEDHKILCLVNKKEQFKKANELKLNDKILINNLELHDWDGKYNMATGWLVGNTLGDGYLTNKFAKLEYWGTTKGYMLNKAKSFLYILDGKKRRPTKFNNVKIGVSSAKLLKIFKNLKMQDKNIKEALLLETSSSFIIGFIRGWFDADGIVLCNKKKGNSIRLSSVNLENLKITQRCLLRLGIKSTIYQNRRKEGEYLLPDGKGNYKYYPCKTIHELAITRSSLIKYNEIINFEDPGKREKLNKIVNNYKKIYKDKKYITFESFNALGIEDVYDCEVEEVHRFDANGIIIHNCAEANLLYNFCNLSTVNQTGIEDKKDFMNRIKNAAFIGTLQASYTDFPYIRPIWKERTEQEALLGVSFTGIADERNKVKEEWLQEGAKLVLETNEKYARKIGINLAARTTLIKPEGTSSCVLGSSSGIHARHSPYYLRRIRFSKDESISNYLQNIVPDLIEEDISSKNTIILTIPQESPSNAIVRADETAIDVFNRASLYYKNWVLPGHRTGEDTHNVSCTINVRDDEWNALQNIMWDQRNNYRAISLFPYDGGTYKQAPFEECTKEVFENYSNRIKDIDLREVREEEDNEAYLLDNVACGGGACEIR